MVDGRSRYGPLAATLGAALLGLSVFLPWYDVRLRPEGVVLFEHAVGREHIRANALRGQAFTAVSAHQVLTYISVVLLVLAGAAFVLALARLASSSPLPLAGSGLVALCGIFATVCVLFRIAIPPRPPYDWLSLSVREGAWLALAGSLAMIVGGLWPGGLKPAWSSDSGQSGLSSSMS